MHAYRRPAVPDLVFRDSRGQVIPYGDRWPESDGDGPDETYSVTVHPERFGPFVDVADAIVHHLATTYDVVREDVAVDGGVRTVHLRPLDPAAAPMTFVFTPAPWVEVTAGDSASIAWFCGCDHCDEDVTVAIETLEQEVSAVVEGGLREWLNDPAQGYQGDDLFHAYALRSSSGEINYSGSGSVDDPGRRAELRSRYADVPERWQPWRVRRPTRGGPSPSSTGSS